MEQYLAFIETLMDYGFEFNGNDSFIYQWEEMDKGYTNIELISPTYKTNPVTNETELVWKMYFKQLVDTGDWILDGYTEISQTVSLEDFKAFMHHQGMFSKTEKEKCRKENAEQINNLVKAIMSEELNWL